jgi:hypothetical protein
MDLYIDTIHTGDQNIRKQVVIQDACFDIVDRSCLVGKVDEWSIKLAVQEKKNIRVCCCDDIVHVVAVEVEIRLCYVADLRAAAAKVGKVGGIRVKFPLPMPGKSCP